MSESMEPEKMVERLRKLHVCNPGCFGRCKECPEAVTLKAANLIESLASENARLAQELARVKGERDEAQHAGWQQ
jgi:hypothetical protein